jgi:tetratricopeptide (TPR) repeat protein
MVSMHSTKWIVGLVALALVSPPRADAQIGEFQNGVRELVRAASLDASEASTARRAGATRLRAALTEWDRQLGTMHGSHVEMGLAYYQRGRLADALRELDAAATERPATSEVQLLRALTLEVAGRRSEAAEAFVAAWTVDRDNPIAAYYVAQRAAGAAMTDRVRARARLLEAYAALDAASAQTTPFPMLEAVSDTLSQAPVLGDTVTSEAFALLRARRFDDAVAMLERDAPPVTGAASRPREHFARGQRNEADNRIAEARREYEAALTGVLAGRAAIFIGLGRLAQVDGDGTAAIDALEQAVRLTPNDPLAHRELADAYASHLQPDEAMAELMAALLIAPRDAMAHAAIGGLYLDIGRAADAVAALTRALALMPARYQARYTLARALDQLGRTEDAARERALFEKARLDGLAQRKRIMAAERDHADEVRRDEPVRSSGK